MQDILQEKAYAFALRCVRLSEHLHNDKHEYVLSRKILDSATNIALFIEEGKQGVDRADFIQKYSVANKEAFKSNLLLRLVRDSEYISQANAESMLADCEEIKAILISSLKTSRSKD